MNMIVKGKKNKETSLIGQPEQRWDRTKNRYLIQLHTILPGRGRSERLIDMIT